MSRTPRDKFLAHLRRTMTNGETATERAEAMRLYAAATSGMADGAVNPTRVDGAIPLPELPKVLPKKPVTEFDETAEFAMREHPDGGLFCLLMLVKPERWMAGLWSRRPDGWFDERTKTDLSFDMARVAIADRIQELGLHAAKVWSYPDSHSSWQEDQAFRMMTFAEQMEIFR